MRREREGQKGCGMRGRELVCRVQKAGRGVWKERGKEWVCGDRRWECVESKK